MSRNVTKHRADRVLLPSGDAEAGLILLRDADYIRRARLFGYPTGEDDDAPDCGAGATLPEWLWRDGEEEQWESIS